MAATWRYGDLQVTVPEQRERFEPIWTALFLVVIVIAPTVAAGWAMLHWFPLSLPVGLTIAALAWIGLVATAVDEDQLR